MILFHLILFMAYFYFILYPLGAGTRIYVHEKIYDKFVSAVVAKAKSIKIGAFTDHDIEQGPQVDKNQFDKVMGYIEMGKAEGAKLMTGGGRYGDKGYFIQPTVFADVKDEMTIAKEEIFGPVM